MVKKNSGVIDARSSQVLSASASLTAASLSLPTADTDGGRGRPLTSVRGAWYFVEGKSNRGYLLFYTRAICESTL